MAEIANVVSGNTITSTWGNQIRDRTIQRYASAAARTAGHPSPTEGDLSYRQDSNIVEVYNGTAWMPVAAAGIIGYAQVVANQTGIGAGDNALTGLSVAVTVVAGRRLQVSGRCTAAAAATSHATLKIKEGSTQLAAAAYNNPPVAGAGLFVNTYLTPTAGSHTYFLAGTAVTSNWDMAASATAPAYIAIEDVGAV